MYVNIPDKTFCKYHKKGAFRQLSKWTRAFVVAIVGVTVIYQLVFFEEQLSRYCYYDGILVVGKYLSNSDVVDNMQFSSVMNCLLYNYIFNVSGCEVT